MKYFGALLGRKVHKPFLPFRAHSFFQGQDQSQGYHYGIRGLGFGPDFVGGSASPGVNSPSPPFFLSFFFNERPCFFCVVSNIWEVCSPFQMQSRRFTCSQHQDNPQLILLLLSSQCCPTMQRASSVHKPALSVRKGSSAWMCAFCLLHSNALNTTQATGKYANRFATNHLV